MGLCALCWPHRFRSVSTSADFCGTGASATWPAVGGLSGRPHISRSLEGETGPGSTTWSLRGNGVLQPGSQISGPPGSGALLPPLSSRLQASLGWWPHPCHVAVSPGCLCLPSQDTSHQITAHPKPSEISRREPQLKATCCCGHLRPSCPGGGLEGWLRPGGHWPGQQQDPAWWAGDKAKEVRRTERRPVTSLARETCPQTVPPSEAWRTWEPGSLQSTTLRRGTWLSKGSLQISSI